MTSNRSLPTLALGCAKIGSALTSLSRNETISLLRYAYELGIRDFDTASIYGQGDSERLLGRALSAQMPSVRISTKGGQRLSPKQALLAHFKRPIRFLAKHAGTAREKVATARTQGVPRCFEAKYIERALEGSLIRLGVQRVDTYYLHCPEKDTFGDAQLKAVLLRAKALGKVRWIGASCDDLDVALCAASDPDIDVVQFALSPDSRCAAILDELADHRKRAVVRGLLGSGAQGLEDRIKASVAHSVVKTIILGTTDTDHLTENVRAFEAATGMCLKDIR